MACKQAQQLKQPIWTPTVRVCGGPSSAPLDLQPHRLHRPHLRLSGQYMPGALLHRTPLTVPTGPIAPPEQYDRPWRARRSDGEARQTAHTGTAAAGVPVVRAVKTKGGG